jgi:hypothetical protein
MSVGSRVLVATWRESHVTWATAVVINIVRKSHRETLLNGVSNDLLPFMVGQSHDRFSTAGCQGCDVNHDLLLFMVGQSHDRFSTAGCQGCDVNHDLLLFMVGEFMIVFHC